MDADTVELAKHGVVGGAGLFIMLYAVQSYFWYGRHASPAIGTVSTVPGFEAAAAGLFVYVLPGSPSNML